MEIKSETVSSVLAKLVTNPGFVEKYKDNLSSLLTKMTLSHSDKEQLDIFFKQYGRQFLASARLLKKRRWDNILQSLQLMPRVFPPEMLSALWESYVSALSLEDNTPKNPLVESIVFCEFISTREALSPLEYAVTIYERVRNQTLVNFSTDSTNYTSVDNFKAIHPCYIIQSFNCNISTLVKSINQGIEKETLKSLYLEDAELLLFYKNWQKDGVASIKINEKVKEFITIYNSLTPVLMTHGVIQKKGGFQ